MDPEIVQPRFLDAQRNVAVNLHCLICEYNLRTLPVVGICPECGSPVARSLAPSLLHLQEPKRLAAIAGGLTWALLVFVNGILLSPSFMGGVAYCYSRFGATSATEPDSPFLIHLGKLIAFDRAVSLILASGFVLALRRMNSKSANGPATGVQIGAWRLLRASGILLVIVAAAGLIAGSIFALKPRIEILCATVVFMQVYAMLMRCVLPFFVLHGLFELLRASRYRRLPDVVSCAYMGVMIAGGLLLLESTMITVSEFLEGPRPLTDLARDVLLYAYPITNCAAIPVIICGVIGTLLARGAIRHAEREARALRES